jgi:hypothetical protein
MVAEHEDTGAALSGIRSLTSTFQSPPDACPGFRALCPGLQDSKATCTTISIWKTISCFHAQSRSPDPPRGWKCHQLARPLRICCRGGSTLLRPSGSRSKWVLSPMNFGICPNSFRMSVEFNARKSLINPTPYRGA